MDDNSKKTVNEGKPIDRQHEEDESWISGEELYTEESTEEDEGKLSDNALQERKKKRENRRIKAKRQASRQVRKDVSSSTDVGKPPLEGKNHVPAPTSTVLTDQTPSNATASSSSSLLLGSVVVGAHLAAKKEKPIDDDEQPDEILWRPKRGSIKLPDLESYRQKQIAEKQGVIAEARAVACNNVDFLTEEEKLRNITNSSVECVDIASRVDSLVDNIYEKMVKETKPFDEERHACLLKDIIMPKDVVQLGGIYEDLSKRDPTLSDALLKMYQLDMILEKKEEKLKALCQKRKSCYSEDGNIISEESGSLLESDITAQLTEESCCKPSNQDDDSITTLPAGVKNSSVIEPEVVKESQDYTVDQEKGTLECAEDHSQLTDDEKRRIEELLTDYDTSQPDAGDSATAQAHSLQSFQLLDEETEKQLEAIEQQLKQLTISALATPATKYTTPADNELNFVELESHDRPHGDEKYRFFSSESKQLLSDIDNRLKFLQVENQEHDANIRELLESLQHSPLQSPIPESEDISWNVTEEDLQNLLLESDSNVSPGAEVLLDTTDALEFELGGELLDNTGTVTGDETLDKSS